MKYSEDSPFYQLLATKYDPQREHEAVQLLNRHPEVATLTWPGPDEEGKPFIKGSTALHYAANDGKNELVATLLDFGADVNASDANWFRSVLSWAANNARIETIQLLLERGASPNSLDCMHAAAWGGSSNGQHETKDYVATLRLLLDAGADKNDSRHHNNHTPLRVAIESGHERAIAFLRSVDALES